MDQTLLNGSRNLKVAASLLDAGISPKYKAFGYLLYLMREFEPDDILSMSNKDMIETVGKKFGVEKDNVVANFKSMINGCAMRNSKRNRMIELFPSLEYHEFPSMAEFVIVAEYHYNLMDK